MDDEVRGKGRWEGLFASLGSGIGVELEYNSGTRRVSLQTRFLDCGAPARGLIVYGEVEEDAWTDHG